MIYPHATPVGEGDGGIRKIGVGENAVDISGGGSQRSSVCQKLFFGVGQCMGRAAEDVVQIKRMNVEPAFALQESFQCPTSHLQDFGLDERSLRSVLRE